MVVAVGLVAAANLTDGARAQTVPSAPAPDSISTGLLVPYVPPPPLAAGANPDKFPFEPTYVPQPGFDAAPVPDSPNALPTTTGADEIPLVYTSVPLPPQDHPHTAFRTSDDRFVVAGMTAAANLHLAQQVEAWAVALERRIGRTTPWLGQGEVVGIAVQENAPATAPYRRRQGWEAGHFYQRIATPPSTALDPEDLQAALAATLLTRCAAALIAPAHRTGIGPRPPDWLSAGIAQSLQPAVSARNRAWVQRELASGAPPPLALADVLALRHLPPGRWREKAYAQAAADFLCPAAAPSAAAETLLRAIATSTPITPAFASDAFSPLFRGRDPEAEWRTFLARWARATPADARLSYSSAPLRAGGSDHAIEQTLLRTLTVRPAEWISDYPDAAPAELAAAELVERRAAPWAPPLAAALRSYLLATRAEASPALQAVFAAYEAYFEAFQHPPAAPPPSPKPRGLFRRRPPAPPADPNAPPTDDAWGEKLATLWASAQSAHQAYLYAQYAQTAWFESVYADYLATHPDSRPSAPAPSRAEPPPRTSVQRYVDTFLPTP